jgi:hypothetical protein
MIALVLALQTIFSRLEPSAPLYIAEIDSRWKIQDREYDLIDTKKPIYSLATDGVLITIHNFPIQSFEKSISPNAQVERWKKQLGSKKSSVTSTSHGGFVGLILESEEMIAGAFQIAPYYRQRLSQPLGELAADWTIKAVGNKVKEHRASILNLIHSFELIEELP